MIFVISKEGEVLMPTNRYTKVKTWLQQAQAKVIFCTKFTIKLLFDAMSEAPSIFEIAKQSDSFNGYGRSKIITPENC